MRPLLTGKELHIVDQQGIDRPHPPLECVDGAMLQCLDHLGDKAFRVHVQHLRVLVALEDAIAYGVHQVRLTQAYTPVDEQGIENASGVVTDLHAGGTCELVGFSLDKALECEVGIRVGLEGRCLVIDGPGRTGDRRCRVLPVRLCRVRGRRRLWGAADLQADRHGVPLTKVG